MAEATIDSETPPVSSGFIRKLVAAFLLYSGKVELQRRENSRDGKAPWRILRYQHVVRPQEHLLPLGRASFISPSVFEEHLQYLAKNCLVRPLDEIVQKLEAGEHVPERTVSLTFDGGYKDFYTNVFPLLKRYHFPATVFLPTAFIGGTNAFWYDKLLIGFMLMREAGLPFPKLSVLDEKFYQRLDSLGGRKNITLPAIAHLIDTLKRSSPQDRLIVLTVIGRVLEDLGGMPALELFLDWKQVQEMARAGVQFGSMGHNHIVYSELTPEEIVSDFRESMLLFHEFGISPSSVTALPDGVITKEARAALHSQKVRFTVGNGQFAAPNMRAGSVKSQTQILGRTDMFEEAAPSQATFACRLWDVEAYGFRF